MTPIDLRDTLTSVSDAVPVPAVDALAVERRVSHARQKRTATLVVACAAATVVLVVGGLAVHPGGDRSPAATPSGPGQVGAAIPLEAEGTLVLVERDGTVRRTGVRVQEVIGHGVNGVVALDPAQHLLVASVTTDGALGTVHDLSEAPVRYAAVSSDGRALAWVDQQWTLHLRGEMHGDWSYDEAVQQGFSGQLWATDGASWVAGENGTAVLYQPQAGTEPIRLPTKEPAIAANLAGGTVAVLTATTVVFFDLDGRRLSTPVDEAIGALAPDGRTYVAAPDVRLLDTRTGEILGSPALPGRSADAIMWADPHTLVVETVQRETSQLGDRTLWTCPEGRSCMVVLSDVSAALSG